MAASHQIPSAMPEYPRTHGTSPLDMADSLTPSGLVSILRLVGLGLGLAATSAAALIGWLALGVETTPTTCGAGGCSELASSPWSSLLGVPILAFGTGLHAVLWLSLLARVFVFRSTALHASTFVLAVLLLVGTAVYLVIGLTSGIVCLLCLTLHGLAIAAAIGVYLAGLGRPVIPYDRHGRIVTSALVFCGAVLVLGFALFGGHRATSASAATSDEAQWLSAVCEPATCPSTAQLSHDERPEAALVLSDPPGRPALVLWVDLACPACRREVLIMKDFLSDLVTTRRAGLSLILTADSTACDPSKRGGDPSRCEAPAALVCATRFGAGPSGLSYLMWELSSAPGYFSLDDRRRWLVQHVDRDAALCLDDELRLGRHGELARHAQTVRALASQMASDPTCQSGTNAAWWCFAATPSMAIVLPPGASPTARTSTARDLALGRISGPVRAQLLDHCLGER